MGKAVAVVAIFGVVALADIGAHEFDRASDNDVFANAELISSLPLEVTTDNLSATTEADEPNHAGYAPNASLWWSLTPVENQTVIIRTGDSSFRTVLGVYTGSAVDQLAEVASSDSYGPGGTYLIFLAQAGTTYYIAVDGYSGATGTVVLNVSAGPSNDDFANAHSLPFFPDPHAYTGSNVNATSEPGEWTHATGHSAVASVWWSFAPQETTLVSVSTDGSAFDTRLGVYTGTSVDALTCVECDDDGGADVDPGTSTLVFLADAGVTYHIAIDGNAGGDNGDFVLSVSGVGVAGNDDFADA